MRETVGNTFIFKLIIVFTLLFSAFLALAITYNKVFKMKNEILSIVEKYEGINDSSMTVINNYLDANGYHTKGNCENGYTGVKDINGSTESAIAGEKYLYCYQETKAVNDANYKENTERKKYDIVVFYKFDLPFLGDLMTFKVTGQTKPIIINK